MVNSEIVTCGASRIYRRDTLDTLPSTKSRSLMYSRRRAKEVFLRYPEIEIFEYVADGCKLSSQFLKRGDKNALPNVYVYVCSTGGVYGKRVRIFMP